MSLKCQPSAASQVYLRYRRQGEWGKGNKGEREKKGQKAWGHEKQLKYKGRGDEEMQMEGERGPTESERKRDKMSRQERQKDHRWRWKHSDVFEGLCNVFAPCILGVRQTDRQAKRVGAGTGSGNVPKKSKTVVSKVLQGSANPAWNKNNNSQRSTKCMSAWMILPFPSTLVFFSATCFKWKWKQKKIPLPIVWGMARPELACNNRPTENYPLILDVCKSAVWVSVVGVLIQQ